ncbi:hypothetical protein FP2506_00585 [Fulvimarina pelagi HTCC2506]|uniref:Uncharacterized protein n=1 Tax=Fulvimarina pelagi HTCC2506 TaxID=314231 RepID=Q0G2I0_9HYPH|nr:hypothetical protein FP2506_00585 [Fulvimarina pelagi HTCC2506]
MMGSLYQALRSANVGNPTARNAAAAMAAATAIPITT